MDTTSGDESRPPRWDEQVAALPELLTTPEAALLLRVSVQKVRNLAQSGEIPATRVGGSYRFSKSKLLTHLGFDVPYWPPPPPS